MGFILKKNVYFLLLYFICEICPKFAIIHTASLIAAEDKSVSLNQLNIKNSYDISRELLNSKEIKTFLVNASIDPLIFRIDSRIDIRFKELLYSEIIKLDSFLRFVSINPCSEKPYNRDLCITSKIKLFLEIAKKSYAIDNVVTDFLLKDVEDFKISKDSTISYNNLYYQTPSKNAHLKNILILRYILSTNIQSTNRLSGLKKKFTNLNDNELFYLDRFNKTLVNLTAEKIKIPYFGKVEGTEFTTLQLENVRLENPIGTSNPIMDLTLPLKKYFNIIKQPEGYVTGEKPLKTKIYELAKNAMYILPTLESDLNNLFVKLQSTDTENKNEENADIKKITALKAKIEEKLERIKNLERKLQFTLNDNSRANELDAFVEDFSNATLDYKNLNNEILAANVEDLESIDMERSFAQLEGLSQKLLDISKINNSVVYLSTNDLHNLAFNELLSDIYKVTLASDKFGIPARLGYSLALAFNFGEINSDEIHFMARQANVLIPKKKRLKSVLNVFLGLAIPSLSILDKSTISPIILNVVRELLNRPDEESMHHGLVPLNKDLR